MAFKDHAEMADAQLEADAHELWRQGPEAIAKVLAQIGRETMRPAAVDRIVAAAARRKP